MKCDEVFEKLSLLEDSELSDKDRTNLREHIAGCDECRKRQKFLLVFQSKLRESLRAEEDCPDFSVSVAEILPARRRRSRLRLVWAFAACVAAALLLCVLFGPVERVHRQQLVKRAPPRVVIPKRVRVAERRPSPVKRSAPIRKPIVAAEKVTPGKKPIVAIRPRHVYPNHIGHRQPVEVVRMTIAPNTAAQEKRAARRPMALVVVTLKSPEQPGQSYGYTRYDSQHKPTEEFRVKNSGDSVDIFWEKSPVETKQKSGGEENEKHHRA